jgi:hypothetical protein
MIDREMQVEAVSWADTVLLIQRALTKAFPKLKTRVRLEDSHIVIVWPTQGRETDSDIKTVAYRYCGQPKPQSIVLHWLYADGSIKPIVDGENNTRIRTSAGRMTIVGPENEIPIGPKPVRFTAKPEDFWFRN